MKSMLMNAQVPLVTMEQPVLICHKDTGKAIKIQYYGNKDAMNCNKIAIITIKLQ